jgi:hypothetical protein
MMSARPPSYNKPEKPGIWMNFDNSVAIYHVVAAEDSFEKAANELFELVREAQTRFPDWPRVLYLEIIGHLDDKGRYEPDFVELQQEFMFATVAPFLTGLEMPLTGALLNPDPQRNDVPERLRID